MARRSCSVEGCTNKHNAHGYCGTHYMRIKRTGSTDGPAKLNSCSVEGCAGAYSRKGYCEKHYNRVRRYGSPEPTQSHISMTDEELKEFILSNIIVDIDSNCWIWNKGKTAQGYGQINYKGRHQVVHRVLYKLMINPSLPDNIFLDHKDCISRACTNPHHVREVTKAQNNSHRVSPQPSNVTGYRNVSFRPGRKKPYRVVIHKNGRQYSFGSYSTPEEADKIAREEREKLFGEFKGTI